MPSDRLTELGIRKSTCGPKQKKITDGKGLYLLVHPNGSKYWRMKYQFSGKEKTLAFGVWPEVSLTEAREMRKSVFENNKSNTFTHLIRVDTKSLSHFNGEQNYSTSSPRQ